MLSKHLSFSLAAIAALLLLGTPSYAEDSQVTGTVTLQGKPLAKGRIFFHLEDGQFVGAQIKDGKYVVKSVPKGNRNVTIEGPHVPAKYGEGSPLVVEVVEGINNFDLDLK